MAEGLYLPALDGLRFFAFLAVFVHHAPASPYSFLHPAREFGWAGVELFFAISAFLFFHLLRAEHRVTGTISVHNFYFRRFLRIYPLMLVYPFIAAAVAGADLWHMKDHYSDLVRGVTNLRVAHSGYATTIPNGQHLWTLSFELQVYLVVPLAFLLYVRLGTTKFIAVLSAIWMLALYGRYSAVSNGAVHPLIWVTPWLRPESVLAGIAIACVPLRISVLASLAIVVLAGSILIHGPNVQVMSMRQLDLYPLVAVIASALLLIAVRPGVVSTFLGSPVLRFLGKISYGLYVYHFMAIALGMQLLTHVPGGLAQHWPLLVGVIFALTLLFATASYYLLERPALRFKVRFSAVQSRPA